MRAQAGEVEHQLDLAPERAAHDGELKAVERRALDEVLGAGHQPQRAPDGALVVGVLPLDGLEQRGLVRRPAHAREGEAEALAVVEAEVLAVVGVPVEREAVLGRAWR